MVLGVPIFKHFRVFVGIKSNLFANALIFVCALIRLQRCISVA